MEKELRKGVEAIEEYCEKYLKYEGIKTFSRKARIEQISHKVKQLEELISKLYKPKKNLVNCFEESNGTFISNEELKKLMKEHNTHKCSLTIVKKCISHNVKEVVISKEGITGLKYNPNLLPKQDFNEIL